MPDRRRKYRPGKKRPIPLSFRHENREDFMPGSLRLRTVPRASTRILTCLLVLCGSAALAGAQTISEFPIPTASSLPVDIAAGPDGNLWFTESYFGKSIGRITPSG